MVFQCCLNINVVTVLIHIYDIMNAYTANSNVQSYFNKGKGGLRYYPVILEKYTRQGRVEYSTVK